MILDNNNKHLEPPDNLTRMIREALVRREFFLNYQPYINLKTQQVAGVEALIRWQHPVHGLILPDYFIPYAEGSVLIDLIGHWVLEQACVQMNQWHATGVAVPTMSVNVSPRQFDSGAMPALVETILAKNKLAPWQLDIEITESSVPLDEKTMCADIAILRQLGVKISIDDFGTGYSSFERLRKMQVDRLKIDRSFVSNLVLNPLDECLVRSMVHLSQQLGVSVVAEGIEDLETSVSLRSMGCDQGQGFHFSRALSAMDCEKYLRGMQHLNSLTHNHTFAEAA